MNFFLRMPVVGAGIIIFIKKCQHKLLWDIDCFYSEGYILGYSINSLL
jgi:hypothetical protein